MSTVMVSIPIGAEGPCRRPRLPTGPNAHGVVVGPDLDRRDHGDASGAVVEEDDRAVLARAAVERDVLRLADRVLERVDGQRALGRVDQVLVRGHRERDQDRRDDDDDEQLDERERARAPVATGP